MKLLLPKFKLKIGRTHINPLLEDLTSFRRYNFNKTTRDMVKLLILK